ncbi:MAG: DUF485 domain-containing protein [Robiginitomaculum sp.]|nr:DUF485 domain-containing protein [Robiginitomaculum sp.]
MIENHSHENEKFHRLVQMRARVIWPLSTFLVMALAGNLYLMSSGAALGSTTVFKGGTITIAIVYSICLVFFGAFIAGFYVWWANTKLDPLMKQVREQAEKSGGRKGA